MLIILLLISQTTCEWVEISQNYYSQEPPRKTIHQSAKIKHEDTDKDFGIYRNSSVEKQWNKGMIDRVSNVGNIRRVAVAQVKTPSFERHAEDFYKHTNGATDLTNQRQVSKYKPFHEDVNINIRNRINLKQNPTSHRKISPNEDKNNQNIESDENKIFKVKVIHKGFETTEKDSNENDDFYNKEDVFKSFQRISNPKKNMLSENKATILLTTTEIPKTEKIKEIFGLNNQKEVYKSDNVDEENYLKELTIKSDIFSNKTITNKPNFQVPNEFFENIEDQRIKSISSTTPKSKTLPRIDFKTNILDTSNTVKEDHVDHNFEVKSNTTKTDAMSGMWKLIKVVSDTIYKNTHRSFKSKIKYLEGLKTTIITSIEEYVESVWPDDVEHRGSARRVRSAQARGHLEIPSSESTLMTISFLTFAVFVIKLVLQVIHTYKNKTMMVTPAVVAAVGRAAAAIRSKQ